VNIALPEGELQRLKNIGNFAVFVFMFDGMTLCLSASNNDFARVRFPVSDHGWWVLTEMWLGLFYAQT